MPSQGDGPATGETPKSPHIQANNQRNPNKTTASVALPIPFTESTHAPSMRSTSPNSPSANRLLDRARAIERALFLSPEGSIPAATLRPFLAALCGYLERDAPLERVEAKIDKLSATLGNQQPPPISYAQAARRGQAGETQL
jgi:hypothetical protein